MKREKVFINGKWEYNVTFKNTVDGVAIVTGKGNHTDKDNLSYLEKLFPSSIIKCK